jgi:predicted unusual protein kinase regulating ubiquinone biosynthesis (AarF/ABC1/UbiB family)
LGGTASEAVKQGLGVKAADSKIGGIGKYALNAKNADRLQKSFRRMRGAALKLGQVMST